MKQNLNHSNTQPTKGTNFIGEVVGVGTPKTIKIKIAHLYHHPLYRKTIRKSRCFLVHSEMSLSAGDRVRIIETRPISKRKKFKVIEKLNL